MRHQPAARRRIVQTLPSLGLILAVNLAGIGHGSAQVATANGESTRAGTVIGSYVDTRSPGDLHEVITEKESGGKPANRTSYLEHTWVFNLPAGSAVTFYLDAFHTANSEGDDFVFAYSTDGGTFKDSWTEILTLTKTVDDGQYMSQPLPPGTAGTVHVRVKDSNRSKGRTQLDQVSVDHMYFEVLGAGGPPAAPTGLAAQANSPASIELLWADNSTNEDGFELERSLDGLLWSVLVSPAANMTTHRDDGLLASTTYYYRVRAGNLAGSSAWSNASSATTLAAGSYTAELVVADTTAQCSALAYNPQTGHAAIVYAADSLAKVARWNGSSWDRETVGGPVTDGVGIAFNSSGRLSICYGWGDLHFAEKIGSSWSIEIVDRDVYQSGHSLVYDPQGNPSLVYRRNHGGRKSINGLWLAQRIGGTWIKEQVDPDGGAARYRSHAFEPGTGDPAIAYCDDLSGDGFLDTLKVAYWNGNSWVLEVVESGSGYGIKPSIAFDAQGNPAFAYSGGDALRYAHWEAGSWKFDTVESGVSGYGHRPSLAFDPMTGDPAILHSVIRTGPDDQTRLARLSGGAWVTEIVAFGSEGNLAFTPSGLVHVSYGSWNWESTVWVATWNGEAWTHEFVGPSTTDAYPPRLGVAPNGEPSLSYRGASNGSTGLIFARR